jgi:alpha/beta superfamily hydrolase
MTVALPAEKTLRFRSGDIELEGRIHLPEKRWPRGCVVCHPHPLYGGDMESSVVVAITSALAAEGVPTLRFNFRGVGASGGTHGGGEAEVGDARAAVGALREAAGCERVTIAGYSFGSLVALRLAATGGDHAGFATHVDSVAAIAPPLSMFDASFVSSLDRYLLVVAGDRDQYCPRPAFDSLVGPTLEPGRPGHNPTTEKVLLPGADHFFAGFEDKLAGIVSRWVRQSLPTVP